MLVVTAPIITCERAQRGWDEHLGRERPAATPGRLAFLEDLSQSWVKAVVLIAMRREYVPGEEPVLLLDRDGALRRALGVEKGATVVFGFDARGLPRAKETGPPTPEAARRLWTALTT